MTDAKHRSTLLASLGLVALYLVSRSINLGAFPIHCDEALYLRWAETGLQNPALRWMSLADGKQPLFIWLEMLALPWFADPLIAGRSVAVAAGLVAMCGVAVLGGVLCRSARIGLAAGAAYVVTPFFLFYDRFAIYESLTVAVVAWASVLMIVHARTKRLDAALGLGIVAGIGCLTKSTTMVIAPMAVVAFVCFHRPWSDRKAMARWLGGIAVAAALASIGVILTHLTPWAGEVGAKNDSFVFGFDALARGGPVMAPENARRIASWLANNLTWPMLALAAAGVFLRRGPREESTTRLWLVASFVGPVLYLVVFGKHLHPRYVLLPCMPLLVLAARALSVIATNDRRGRMAAALILAWPIAYSTWLVVAPASAPLHAEDRRGYVEDWSAGTGVRELRDRLRAEAAAKPILVITEGQFGLFPAALSIGDTAKRRIGVVGVEDPRWDAIERLAKPDRPTFLVLWSRAAQSRAKRWPVRVVAEWRRGPIGSPLVLLAAR